MSTGDPVQHCDICGHLFYTNIGHNCHQQSVNWIKNLDLNLQKQRERYSKQELDWLEKHFNQMQIDIKARTEGNNEH